MKELMGSRFLCLYNIKTKLETNEFSRLPEIGIGGRQKLRFCLKLNKQIETQDETWQAEIIQTPPLLLFL